MYIERYKTILFIFITFLLSASHLAANGSASISVKGNLNQLHTDNDKIPIAPGTVSQGGRIGNAAWGEPEIQKMTIEARLPAKGNNWQQGSITFTPRKSGTVEISFKASIPKNAIGNGIMYDSITIKGAQLKNLGFEQGAGPGTGWTQSWLNFPGLIIKNKNLAQAGSSFAFTWPKHDIAQYVKVQNRKKVSISFMYRAATKAQADMITKHPASKQARGMDLPAKAKGRRLRDIVKDKYPDGNFDFSVAPGWDKMHSTEYYAVVNEFGSISPYTISQGKVNPTPDEWKWQVPDQWMKFITEHDQVMRMHSPISPQCGVWSMTDSRTGSELDKKMTNFMTQLCRRYNGKKNVKWLEVVNETIGPDGQWVEDKKGTTSWEMPWVKMGYKKVDKKKYPHLWDGKIPNYIIKAFKIATKEAPDLRLMINQHKGMEKPMWNAIFDTVRYLRDIGCRVDAIGWQAHIKLGSGFSPWETMEVDWKEVPVLVARTHANKLDFIITEADIIFRSEKPMELKQFESKHDKHTQIYSDMLKALLKNRHTGIIGINYWTIVDKNVNNSKDEVSIGLWDRNWNPKPVYYEIQKILENPPPVLTQTYAQLAKASKNSNTNNKNKAQNKNNNKNNKKNKNKKKKK